MSEPELSFHELTQRLRLRTLPVGEPSPDLWQRIAATHAGRMRRTRMRSVIGSCLAVMALVAVLVAPKWLAPSATQREVDWQARAQALELQLHALQDANGTRTDTAGALDAQSEIARVDDALQTAYDTGAEKDQLELLWKRRSELLGTLISVRQRHVEISRI